MRKKAREMPCCPKREPTAIPACEACGAFQPECLVPDREGAIAMCWPCAHAFVDHGTHISRCVIFECECPPESVYPERVLAARRKRASHF